MFVIYTAIVLSKIVCGLSCKNQKKCRNMSNISTFIQNGEEMSRHQVSNVGIKYWSLQRMSCWKGGKVSCHMSSTYVDSTSDIFLWNNSALSLFFWRTTEPPQPQLSQHYIATNFKHLIKMMLFLPCPFGTSASSSCFQTNGRQQRQPCSLRVCQRPFVQPKDKALVVYVARGRQRCGDGSNKTEACGSKV